MDVPHDEESDARDPRHETKPRTLQRGQCLAWRLKEYSSYACLPLKEAFNKIAVGWYVTYRCNNF